MAAWKTVATPLVWVPHIAYEWILVHLVLRVLVELSRVGSSIAVHALTVGASGGTPSG